MARFPDTSPTAASLTDRVFGGLIAEGRKREHFYPLHVGDTYLDPIFEARAEAQKLVKHPHLHRYCPVQGTRNLQQAIIGKTERTTGVILDPRHLQVVSGATSGLSVVTSALFDPGDEVLLPSPYWPLIRGILAARGVAPIEVPFFTKIQDPNFDFLEALETSTTSHTRGIYLNTPNNPTGVCLSEAQIRTLIDFAERKNLWILADEAYEDLWFERTPPPRIWTQPSSQERCIVVHTLSKSYGLAGARIGYVHGPKDAMKAIRAVQTYQTYCAAGPMQQAAANALNLGDSWQQKARALYANAAKATANALRIPVPTAGTFVFFDASSYLKPGEHLMGFLKRCLDGGVMLTPGTASGKDFDTWCRLCFTCLPPDQLRTALTALSKVIAQS